MDKFFSKRRLLILVILVFIASVLGAVDKRAGEFGMQFLKIPVSPELSGMGGTGEMLHSSPLNMFHHPAAFDWQRGASVAASQNSWLFDTNLYTLAWRIPDPAAAASPGIYGPRRMYGLSGNDLAS